MPWWAGWPVKLPAAFWVMAALAVAVDARPHPTTRRRAGSVVLPSVCFTFAVVLAWGFLPALAVQAVTVAIAGARSPHPARRTTHLLLQYAAALGAAAAVAQAGGLRLPLETVRWTDALLVLAAAVAWTVTRTAMAMVLARLVAEVPRDPADGGRARVELPTTGAMLLLGAVLPAVAAASAALVPLVLVPLFAVDRMARSTRDHARSARTDVLTGLPNRRALLAAKHRLARSRRGALLLFDLDRFKDVNDALGQPGGDRLLAAVADRLSAAVAPHDVVARLGGDEFAVLATRVDDAADARRLALHLASVLDEPIVVDGLPVDVSAAVGVALHPAHGDDVAALLQHAEIAMYEAKHRGEPCAVYAPGADGTPHRLALLADLRAALQGDTGAGTVALWYQPQVAIATGEVLGVEALLRWHHPVRGMVDPEEILRVAEPTAVMRLLTAKVLTDAVAQTARWRAAGHLIRVSVNVSVRDLHTGDLARQVEDLLDRHDIPAALLQIELTESALLPDARQVLATIRRLHQLGVAISLDDFGTGWSSLQHLRRLPLAEVKIDRSFVLGMTANAEDAAIVRSVVELAAALNLRVVAEGVEDERTWRALHAAGCHSAQGWFYARPMPADEFATWLSRYRPVGPTPTAVPGSAANGEVGTAKAGAPQAATSVGTVTLPLPARPPAVVNDDAAIPTAGGRSAHALAPGDAAAEDVAAAGPAKPTPAKPAPAKPVQGKPPAVPRPAAGPVIARPVTSTSSGPQPSGPAGPAPQPVAGPAQPVAATTVPEAPDPIAPPPAAPQPVTPPIPAPVAVPSQSAPVPGEPTAAPTTGILDPVATGSPEESAQQAEAAMTPVPPQATSPLGPSPDAPAPVRQETSAGAGKTAGRRPTAVGVASVPQTGRPAGNPGTGLMDVPLPGMPEPVALPPTVPVPGQGGSQPPAANPAEAPADEPEALMLPPFMPLPTSAKKPSATDPTAAPGGSAVDATGPRKA
ncbi:diguanylate cyclase (GGDEF)-like protein [Spirilliplanes yamanashiensis]|nr:EAL domain-containing protein [Spirilliplanes yamanashiensis]MDP9819820.1 diguanylate cyclase (GGDEF)-like protein [Spirilliplanes yamanashiensis]